MKCRSKRFWLLGLLLSLATVVGPLNSVTHGLDLDGDGKSELVVFRKGVHYARTPGASASQKSCGGSGDIPVSGKYLPGSIGQVASYNPSFGLWQICGASATTLQFWGTPGDIPVPADFDGDTLLDFTVFRPATGEWFILYNPNGAQAGKTKVLQYGRAGDIPVPADYNGDGKDDFAVARFIHQTGSLKWFVRIGGAEQSTNFGLFGDVPVAGDFDGDGDADIAVWRPSDGIWYLNLNSVLVKQQWGIAGDIPVELDFDGDGRRDFGIFRPKTGNWFILTRAGVFKQIQWGVVGDRVAGSSEGFRTEFRAPTDFNGDRVTDLVLLRAESDAKLKFVFNTGNTLEHPLTPLTFGLVGDRVAPADYDGDGVTDIATVRIESGFLYWRFLRSSQNFSTANPLTVLYGLSGDQVIPADYDGDFRTDLGVVRVVPGDNLLWIPANSGQDAITPLVWGVKGDRVLSADLDFDKKSDFIAVRTMNGALAWFVRTASGVVMTPRFFGLAGDTPFIGDFDGDGRAQIAVIRELDGGIQVFIDGLANYQWGLFGDIPVSGAFSNERLDNSAVWREKDGQGTFYIRQGNGAQSTKNFGVIGDLPLNLSGVTSTSSLASGGSSGTVLRCVSRSDVSAQPSGFIWKPISDLNGKLAIAFPANLSGQILNVALVEEGLTSDTVVETLTFSGNLDDGRPVFRGQLPGANYPAPVVLVRQSTSSENTCIDVRDPSQLVQ